MRAGVTCFSPATTSDRTPSPCERAVPAGGRHSAKQTCFGTHTHRYMPHSLCSSALGQNGSSQKGAPEVHTSINPLVASVTVSKTMALTDLATELREKGVDVVSLAAGEPDFDTPTEVTEAGIQALRAGHTHYTANAGLAALRTAIANKLEQENGLHHPAAEILVSNGAKQSVWQAVAAVCSPGDEVIIPAPFWVSYPQMARLVGAEPVIVPTGLDQDFLLSPEQLQAAITPQSRLLILCSPSNPSGAVYSQEALQALAEVVAQHPNLLVLADEIYEHIIYPPAQHHSFGALPGMQPRTLTVNGFSKAFAMTGWRLGYLAGPAWAVKAAARIQGHSTSGASSISQHAGIAALNLGLAGGAPVAAMRQKFQARRDFMMKELQTMQGLEVRSPSGAFYIFAGVQQVVEAGAVVKGFGAVGNDDDLCRYLLEKHAVGLVPGDAFGMPGFVRISYAASQENLQKAMDRLRAGLSALEQCQEQRQPIAA